jgi:hypothetical protein
MQFRSIIRTETARSALATVFLAGLLAACGGGNESVSNGGSNPSSPPPSGGSPTTPAASNCSTAPDLFTQTVWPSMATKCAGCHVNNGVASGSGIVFTAGAGNEVRNYNVLRNFASTKSALLLSKSIGLPIHTGGNVYGSENSTEYQNLAQLVAVMRQSCEGGAVAASAFWNGVSFKDDLKVLASASLVFAGRNPTAAEISAVAAGGTGALRSTIRSYMQGPAFDRFLDEVGDTHFIPQGVIAFGNNVGLNAADFPSAADLINNANNFPGAVRAAFERSIRREPVELMKFIVRNEADWRDMVRGRYTVANGVIATNLNAAVEGSFVNQNDEFEWRRAVWPDQRLGGSREHAGVLSTLGWLQRFPTTATNRNRHRVYIMSKQFLATDVAALAQRPIDDATPFAVPVVQNPGCSVCHNVIDPKAAGWQNWDETNRYRPFRTNNVDHALPASYRANNYPARPADMGGGRWYVAGDNWFRDQLAPGYGQTPMPGGYVGSPTALQWLGEQIAADPRFALGAVHFWFEGVFGRAPLVAPIDAADMGYAAQLAAYNAQNEEFQQIAARFVAGGYRVKDLLVDLITSNWYRAERVSGMNAARAAELRAVGSANMLTPRQLQDKMIGLLGQGWPAFQRPANNPFAYTAAEVDYGNFDGNTRIKRSKEHTMMQTLTLDRLVAERSCNITQADFNRAADARLLFRHATLQDSPATEAGRAAIRANIQHLHKWLLKEDLAANDPEVERTFQLFMAVWNDRATAAGRALSCVLNNNNDPNYVGRSWAAIVAYMVGDPKFVYE